MKPTQRCGGIFQADLTVPLDPIDKSRLRYCVCGLRGQAGDARHPLPEPPAEADHGQRAAGEEVE